MVESAAGRQIFCPNVGQLWMRFVSQRIRAMFQRIETMGTKCRGMRWRTGKIFVRFASTPRYNESTLVLRQERIFAATQPGACNADQGDGKDLAQWEADSVEPSHSSRDVPCGELWF